jgi:16S rRNA (cytosine1402-N4)-methyltransferase
VTDPHATGYHAPVMVGEVMDVLRPERGGTYLDGTLGGGGHAEALLERGPAARLIGVDRDPDALAEAGTRLSRFGDRVRLVRANFADAPVAAAIAHGSLAGVLLDLGISSHQIDADDRGFTFRPGAPLDMRMAGASAGEPTAAELLNALDETELANVFYRYGEEKRSRRLARVVAEMRAREPFARSEQLVEAIDRALGPRTDAGDRARIFQALRIAVNHEIDALQRALEGYREALGSGGVLRGAVVPLPGGPAGEERLPRLEPALRLPPGAAGLRLPRRAAGRDADPPLRHRDGGRGAAERSRPQRAAPRLEACVSASAAARTGGLRAARAARAARWEAPQGERLERRRRRRAIAARILFFLAVGASLASVIWRQTAGVDRQRALAAVQAEISVAEAERVELTNRVQALQTRARITRVAGTRLGLHVARDDEVVLLPVPAAAVAEGRP